MLRRQAGLSFHSSGKPEQSPPAPLTFLLFGRICNPAVFYDGICNPSIPLFSQDKGQYKMSSDCSSVRMQTFPLFAVLSPFCPICFLFAIIAHIVRCRKTGRDMPRLPTPPAEIANAACGNGQRRTRCLQSPHAAFEITPCSVCGILTPKSVQKQPKTTCFARCALQNGTLE